MKNWTLKSNLRKAILFCLFLVLGLAFSSLVFVDFNNEVDQVYAKSFVELEQPDLPEQNQNRGMKLNFINEDGSIFDPDDGGVSFQSITIPDNDMYEVTKGTLSADAVLNGGSCIKFTSTVIYIYAADSSGNVDTNNSTYEITITCSVGCEITGFEVDTYTNSSGGNTITLDTIYSLEVLDPEYDPTITITPIVEEILYKTTLYWENKLNRQQGKEVQYSISGLKNPTSIPTSAEAEDISKATSPRKSFQGYFFKYDLVSGGVYNNYTITKNNTTITAQRKSATDSTKIIAEIEFTYSEVVDGSYYKLSAIKGYGDFDQTSSRILVAYYKTIYEVTVNHGNNYWDVKWGETELTKFRGVNVGGTAGDTGTIMIQSTSTGMTFLSSKYSSKSSFFETNSNTYSSHEYWTREHDEKTVFVYNYGHYITGWSVTVEISGTTYSLTYAGSAWSHSTTSSTTSVSTLKSTNMGALATKIDKMMSGHSGYPTVNFTPVWAAVELDVTISGVSSSIQFGTNYALSGGTASSGQSIFAYSATGDTQNTIISPSPSASFIWNYTQISPSAYEQTSDSNAKINLSVVELPNAYKVELKGITQASSNSYELESDYASNYKFGDTGNADGELTYNTLYPLSSKVKTTYKLSDLLAADMKVYYDEYKLKVQNNSFDVCQKIDYSSSKSVSDSKLEWNAEEAAPTLWIYLANAITDLNGTTTGSSMTGLPMFKSKYCSVIGWAASTNAFTTAIYKEESYDAELAAYNILQRWDYSCGTELRCITVNRLYLYYANESGSYDIGHSIKAEFYGANTWFEFEGESGLDFPGDNYVERGFFNGKKAKDDGYGYKVDGNSLSVYNEEDVDDVTKWTTFKIDTELTGVALNDCYLITSVIGGVVFEQKDTDPIITIVKINTYNFTIDNSTTYWSDLTVENKDLYGAESHTDSVSDSDFAKTGFPVQNNSDFAYAFMTNSGYGMHHYDEMKSNNINVSVGEDKYYFVYNYGHEISGYKIEVNFTGLSAYNGRIIYDDATSTWMFKKGDTTSSTAINKLSGKTFIEVAETVDYYIATNGLTDDMSGNVLDSVSVIITPLWEKVEISPTFMYQDNSGTSKTISIDSLDFGGEYEFEFTNNPDNIGGQSLLACADDDPADGDANLIALKAIWNYQHIKEDQFSFAGNKKYAISLEPVWIDNIYRVELRGMITNESGKYQLLNSSDEGFLINKFSDYSTSSLNGVTYLTIRSEGIDEFTFEEYKDEVLVDNYIDRLKNLKDQYNAGIDGADVDFSFLKNVFTTAGTIDNDNTTLTTASSQVLYIYLANNQSYNLPEFHHELAKNIVWENASNWYATSNYIDVYKDECAGDQQGKWCYNHNDEDFELNAKFVYSFRLYNKTNTTIEDNVFASVNSKDMGDDCGYAGAIVPINLLDEDDCFAIVPKDNTLPDNQDFECWMLDSSHASDYNISGGTGSSGTITLSKSGVSWTFIYTSRNIYNDHLYYITGVKSASGIFEQLNTQPIVYAKLKNHFDLLIDNSDAYWKNKDSSNAELYGAYSYEKDEKQTDEPSEFYKTKIKVANLDKYSYSFLASENGSNDPLSFMHLEEWNSDDAKNNWYATPKGMSSSEAYYYVFNYGHYIYGWKLILEIAGTRYYLIKNGTTWNIQLNAPDYEEVNKISEFGSSVYLSDFAAHADEFAADEVVMGSLTLIPVWRGVNVKAYINPDFSSAADGSTALSDIITFGSNYKFNNSSTQPIGKTLISYYYGDVDGGQNNKIACVINGGWAGVWNYRYITASNYSYGGKDILVGDGIYSITLNPYYVNNIYKVNLDNVTTYEIQKDASGNVISYTYNLIQASCDFTFNSTIGGYTTDSNPLTFKSVIDDTYEFLPYNSESLMDSYIENTLKHLIADYEMGINTDKSNTEVFDIFRKVYYTNSSTAATALTLTTASQPDFFIYLANDQQTGGLPVFDKQGYYTLIFWENDKLIKKGGLDSKYTYPTDVYDPDIHKEEFEASEVIDGATSYGRIHHENGPEINRIWVYTDGYNTSTGSIKLNAVYFRKNYKINIDTLNLENGAKERRGYVRLKIADIIYDEDDPTIVDQSKDYLVMFYGGMMSVYAYSDTDSLKDMMNSPLDEMRLYEGCDVTMTVFDQSKNASAMSSGYFDDMIGFKYSKLIEQSVTVDGVEDDTQTLFSDHKVDNDYEFFIDNETIKVKEFKNKSVINIKVFYQRLVYSLKFKIDNHEAGEFQLYNNGTDEGYMTDFTVSDIKVQQLYRLSYYAKAGFKLQDNAFVISNNVIDPTLQKYVDESEKMLQDYILTHTAEGDDKSYNYISDTINGTWLRKYFYEDPRYSSYALDNTNLGELIIQTCPIVFDLGIKVYDSSDEAYESDNFIIETPEESRYHSNIALDANTAEARTPMIQTYLTNDSEAHYIYVTVESNPGTKYALLNSRLYFPNDTLDKSGSEYTEYVFLLVDAPTNKAKLSSAVLSKMVNRFVDGKIIDPADRQIFIMLEVRKLLTIEMMVEQVNEYDNNTTRTTTLTNGVANTKNITIESGTPELVDISGAKYFKTTTGSEKVVVYTYYGNENILSSSFDSGSYYAVEYYLNESTESLPETTFVVTQNSKLIIKYLPVMLKVQFIYRLNSEIISLSSALETYIKEEGGAYKPTLSNTYYAGMYVNYIVECINDDFNVLVKINGRTMGQTGVDTNTNIDIRKLYLVQRYVDPVTDTVTEYGNGYLVTTEDYAKGEIVIEVMINDRTSSKVTLNFHVGTKTLPDDDYGTFDVYEEDDLKASNQKQISLNIIEYRALYVKLNIPVGYKYVGISCSGSAYSGAVVVGDKIRIIESFDPKTDGLEYSIVLTKIEYGAQLSVDGKIGAKSTYSIKNETTGSAWGKELHDLYVGCTIEFKDGSDPTKESLEYFYYLDKDGNEIPLKDGSVPATSIKVTSDFLEEIGAAEASPVTTIMFGIKTIAQHKLVLIINGEDFIKEDGLKIENKTTGAEYKAGDYVDIGTELYLMVETLVTGKYDIEFKETHYDIIERGDELIELDKTYEYSLIVQPKKYNVNIEEKAYTTLSAIEDETPNYEVENMMNNIATSGYSYNSTYSLSVIRNSTSKVGTKDEKFELYQIHISGNDLENEFVVDVHQNSVVVYKIVDGDREIVGNSELFGFKFEISATQVQLTYTTSNNFNIRFDYKQYKLITS